MAYLRLSACFAEVVFTDGEEEVLSQEYGSENRTVNQVILIPLRRIFYRSELDNSLKLDFLSATFANSHVASEALCTGRSTLEDSHLHVSHVLASRHLYGDHTGNWFVHIHPSSWFQ